MRAFLGVSFFVVVSTVDLAGFWVCDSGISFGREQNHQFSFGGMAQPPGATTDLRAGLMVYHFANKSGAMEWTIL